MTVSFKHLFTKDVMEKLNTMSTTEALKITSIGAKRILTIIDDLRQRVEYALLLPTINDFIQANDEIPEKIRSLSADLQEHQNLLSDLMTTDGEPRPGKSEEFTDEVIAVKEYARYIVREMNTNHEPFDMILARRERITNGKPKIVELLIDIYQLEFQYFSKHSKEDAKRLRIKNEIEQMRPINQEHIDALKKKDTQLGREKELKIRLKEEELDRWRKLLIQAKTGEVVTNDNNEGDELITQEESLKNEYGNVKQTAYKAQSEHMQLENDKRRSLRKSEEDLQRLISQYDSEMNRLTTESAQAYKDMTEIESKLSVLKVEMNKVREKRAPYMNDENAYSQRELNHTKVYQDMITASYTLQFYIRKYLRTAPKKPSKKPKKK